MVGITRKFTFDAAHRVLGHEGRCKDLHGHRYVAEVTVTAPKLDNLGRVIDFSVLKDKIGKWIDERLDHNILLNPSDKIGIYLEQDPHEKMPYFMNSQNGVARNPTAENIAEDIFVGSEMLLKCNEISVTNVRVWETENCYADYNNLSLSDNKPS